MPDTQTDTVPDFASLQLAAPVLDALADVGYESPSPIQAQTIPHVLAGHDVLAQAQTGTGKTAAFALPLLSRLDLGVSGPQALVLTPTRELAIQVAEAFQRYASRMKGFHVLPIYGGQDYAIQLKQLKRGAHVVVGTPGRVMDHMRRGTLKLDSLRCLVLDEADEMLRMGFIDDVEWILEQSPNERQIALFSATLPDAIRRIARKHLKSPAEITIKVKTTTAESIRQRYWLVSGLHKLDALTRILEAENSDGIIIFVRTKTMTTELAEKLTARGYSVAALSGDIPQKQRERTIEKLKSGDLDIIVATDVAARGLDVDRISHVINYDIPHDTESYVHRIGRTGRFGRKGEAILFVAPRERHMLGIIERATRQKIELMELPSTEMLNSKRIEQFTSRIGDTLAGGNLDFFYELIDQYHKTNDVPVLDIAAALAKLVQGETPLLLKTPASPAREQTDGGHHRDKPARRPERYKEHAAPDRRPERPRSQNPRDERSARPETGKKEFADRKPATRPFDRDRPATPERPDQRPDRPERGARPETGKKEFTDRKPATRPFDRDRPARPERPGRPESRQKPFADRKAASRPVEAERPPRPAGTGRPKPGMERFRIDVGQKHGIKAGNLVGLITSEAGLTTRNIDQIAIHDHYSTVDLPEGMPREIYRDLKNAKLAGQRLNIRRFEPEPGEKPFKRRDEDTGRPPRRDDKPRARKPHRGK